MEVRLFNAQGSFVVEGTTERSVPWLDRVREYMHRHNKTAAEAEAELKQQDKLMAQRNPLPSEQLSAMAAQFATANGCDLITAQHAVLAAHPGLRAAYLSERGEVRAKRF